LKRQRPYLIYFTGASVESKCWPKDRFVKLIDKAASTLPEFDHLILRGHRPEESVDDMLAELKAHSNVGGTDKLSLEECIGMLKGASLTVTNDNGVRNLAIASDSRTLGIF